MTEEYVMLTWMLAAVFGVEFAGALVAESILSVLRWYFRKRGWLPTREVVFRICILDDDEQVRVIHETRGCPDD